MSDEQAKASTKAARAKKPGKPGKPGKPVNKKPDNDKPGGGVTSPS